MADLAHLTNCFQKWRLKPRTPRLWHVFFSCTTSGHVVNWVFLRILNVWSTAHTQLILMLHWVWYLTHTAAELKSCHNLTLKLTATSWYASASTFCTSALAFCYSVAEYHCPHKSCWHSTPQFHAHDFRPPVSQLSSMVQVLASFTVLCCQPITHFTALKHIHIGVCMLMSLTSHLHGSHLDIQCGQTWHLLTWLHIGKKTGCQLLWSTMLL